MLVLVTGGTGFVGSHATQALINAGHEVRLLARTPSKVDTVFRPHGMRPSEVVQGDITDAESVAAAVDGCDAVVHAAAVVATGPAAEAEVRSTNFVGAQNVFDAAVAAGCDPIINISSSAALFPYVENPVTPDHPVGTTPTAYGQTKAQAERYARGLQDAGHPVTTFYPTGILGPHDPAGGELMAALVLWITQGLPTGGMSSGYVDVRDIAAAIVAAMQPGQGARRYLLWGTHATNVEMVAALKAATGRDNVRSFKVPRFFMQGWGKAGDLARKYGQDLLLTSEGFDYMYNFYPGDQSATEDELGVHFRPLEDTVADALLWLHETGKLDGKHVGKLAIT